MPYITDIFTLEILLGKIKSWVTTANGNFSPTNNGDAKPKNQTYLCV